MPHPIQIYLDDADFRALREWARARGWTLSQAVRVAVKALTRSRQDNDPLLAASGMIQGLPPDLSERFDQYLNLTFVAGAPIRYGEEKPKRRTRKAVRR